MVQSAHALGYESLGITDRDGVYGLPRSHAAGKALNLKIIAGTEVAFENEKTIFLLARNKNGYGNLCEFLSRLHGSHEHNQPKRASFQSVMEKSQDLYLAIPAENAGSLPLPLLKDAFGGRCALVVSRLLDGMDEIRESEARALSQKFDLPIVASLRPLFHTPHRKPLQDIQTCIRHNCTLKSGGFRLLPNSERLLKNREAISLLFKNQEAWLEETLRISDDCNFSLDEIKYQYPQEWLPPGQTGSSFLNHLTWEGAKLRYGENLPTEVKKQITKELQLISDLDYSDYFLTIWDIVQFAAKKNILYQGRGSAANSIVCYVLGITAIDPIRMSLLFERFISRERKEPPDIDIDFEHERREEVIQYIYERYGRSRAAITAEVICFRKKSAFREVAKVFDLPVAVVEKLQIVTHRRSLDEINQDELLKEVQSVAPQATPLLIQKFLTMALAIQGFPRHLGTHVGGFVLSHDLLSRNVPIENAAMPNRTIIQWDKNDLDALGFVRVDILGLGILTCIRKCLDLVELTYQKKMTLASIPAEDPKVYDSCCEGDTVGVFQIESRAQMNMLPRLKPRNFFDLVVEISLVRPGPIQGEMVHPYLRRRAGKEPIEYAHPDLEAILKKTYGVPLFQEQIMKMAMTVADFTAGEADELRRAMGSWRREGTNRLAKMGEKFCQGLSRRGISRDYSERIFSQIEGFAEYGFPESHAASFAILAYATAYLRLYYPDAYLAAILNSQPMGFYSSHSLIHDGKRHGVGVVDVDIQSSHWDNRLEKPGMVRLGFREIKGFHKRVGLAIEAARGSQPFLGILDFVLRVQEKLTEMPLTKRDLFCLAGADAFRSIGYDRRKALWEIQALSLRDSHLAGGDSDNTLLPQEQDWERITGDYQAKGVSLYGHPIALFRSYLDSLGVTPSRSFRGSPAVFLKNKRKIKVAGFVICRQMPPTASGVLFITLEDEFGFINLVIWKDVYERFRELLITQSFLICEGEVQKPDEANVIHVIVKTAAPLFSPEQPALTLPSYDFH